MLEVVHNVKYIWYAGAGAQQVTVVPRVILIAASTARHCRPAAKMAKGKVGAGGQKLKGIKCKAKRVEVFQKLKKEGDAQKRKDRKKRQKDAEALGDEAPDLKLQQKTLDNTRELDETIVRADDPDIAAEDSFDEFAGHFSQRHPPRTVVPTEAAHSGPALSAP